jgi:signal transduction histidine kinase
MRNPLSAVLTNINFIQTLIRGAPEVEEALSDSLVSCAMLGQVIGNLDVLARVLASGQLATQPTHARRMADEAATRFAPQADMTRVRIEVCGEEQPVVLAEPSFFARALENLLANALQYSPAGGTVRISCESTGDVGALVIEDEGPLVPADLRVAATSAEWQGQAKHRYEGRYGRGLGLYCAAEAARIAGARVTIGERAGRSVLELSAPLATAAR